MEGLSKYSELRMKFLGVREEDFEESFIRAQGPGGQKVNKTSSCVYLKHLPTGIEVKCQEQRSQAQNRIRAREIITEKISEFFKKKELLKEQARQRDIRKLRRRSKYSKEKILEKKRRHSEKKRLRSRVVDIE